jgi:hypothetical protein
LKEFIKLKGVKMKLILIERKDEAKRIIEEMNAMAQEKSFASLFRDERFEECQARLRELGWLALAVSMKRRKNGKGEEMYVRFKLFSLDSKEVKALA